MKKMTETAMRAADGGARYYVRVCGRGDLGYMRLTTVYSGYNWNKAQDYFNSYDGMNYMCLIWANDGTYVTNY